MTNKEFIKKGLLLAMMLISMTSNIAWGQKPLDAAEVMPSFPGGETALMQWLSQNITYPTTAEKNGVQGRVIVRFAIGKDGAVCDPEIFRSIDPALDNEALRVIKAMPKWKPGMQKGVPVAVNFTLPITFRLPEKTKDVKPEERHKNSEILKAKEVISEERPKYGEKPLDAAEVMPSFPGGTDALIQWLSQNITYPTTAEKNGVQGRVIVRFAIGKDGGVCDPKIIHSVDPELDKEALRVIKAMPKWKPGMQKGVPVAVYFSLPITFQLPEPETAE